MANFHSGYLEQGAPLGMTTKGVSLIADNTRIDCTGISLLLLSSDSATADNRTFLLNSSPLVGHRLVVTMVTGSSKTAQLANSGTCHLQAAWEPVQYDTINLVSDGTYWLETGRSQLSTLPSVALTSAHLLVGSAANIATDVAVSGDVTLANTGAVTIAALAVTTAKINTAAVTLAKLATGITPSHVVKYAANYTTTGGAAAEAITIAGALATDVPLVMLQNNGTDNVTFSYAVLTNGTLTVTFSADPKADTIISYMILRAAA